MAKDTQQGLMPSVLDRLMNPETTGTAWRRGYDLQQIVDAIRRDLEELLNSHQMYAETLEDWPELGTSLLTYGMPDFASLTNTAAKGREAIGKRIEEVIARFEPRLRNVHATIVEGTNPGDRHVRFHLDAQINVDPAPEVAFETIVELTTGRAAIQASDVIA